MIHTVKGFIIVNEVVVDAFLEFLCFLHDLVNAGNLTFDSSVFSKSGLYIWKFSIHILLKPSLKDFEHNPANMQNQHNCVVIWASLALLFFGIGMKTDFSSLVATAEFSKFDGMLGAAL